jgi:hypothetical protein
MSLSASERAAGVRRAIDAAIRLLEDWRDEADGIAAVECGVVLPCDKVIEHPSGWRESATRKLTVEIRMADPKEPA